MDRSGITISITACRFLFLCCLLFGTRATAAGLEIDGSAASVKQSASGVPVVDIAKPNKRGLSHNKYRKFNVDRKGLILNNSEKATVNTQLGGRIEGNARLKAPARVILNEVTSTNPSKIHGYTEVAGQKADVVIANPNGISINGGGFINTSRVTLTTGIPRIDTLGDLAGFDVRGGEIHIEGDGLNTLSQEATSIYSHYLHLNASLHARDLDIGLGLNQVDYPGRKVIRNRSSGQNRVLLDSSALGGMYANKIVLVGTDKGLGMNMPQQVIASDGDIEITADGRLRLQQLDASGDIRLNSAESIDSRVSVYAAEDVVIQAKDTIRIETGMVAAGAELTLDAQTLDNQASVYAGLQQDGSMTDSGRARIVAQQMYNEGEVYASNRLQIDGGTLHNRGLLNAGSILELNSGSLLNEATIFSGGNANFWTVDELINSTDASFLAIGSMVFAADHGLHKSAQITNQRGLIQTLEGDIDIHAEQFKNIGFADFDYGVSRINLGTGKKVTDLRAAMNINLAYSSGFTKHKSEARSRWVQGVLKLLRHQAPLLYEDNRLDIITERSARFTAIETLLENKTETTPAYVDSGRDLNLHLGQYLNQDSVTSASRNINLDIDDSYLNVASSRNQTVTDYQYYTYADHDKNSRDEDKYSSHGHSGYVAVKGNRKLSADTVTQAGVGVSGKVGGKLVNSGVLTGDAAPPRRIDPAEFDKSMINLPANDFGLFVTVKDPDSRYLVVTNPKLANPDNYVGSDYLLERLEDAPGLQLKLLGDAFYEHKLIRDSVFAQSGKRFLNSSITSDNEQFRYLMDNALRAHRTLQLAPGVALGRDQINRLAGDILWLVKHEIGGEEVLVPTLYLASGSASEVDGGRVVAGEQTRLQVAGLVNEGMLQASGQLSVDAKDVIENRGLIHSTSDLELVAEGDIVNRSGRIEGRDVHVVSRTGDIRNTRNRESFAFKQGEIRYQGEMLGQEGKINATGTARLKAAQSISVEGSSISATNVELNATQVNIETSVAKERFDAGDREDYFRESSTRHVASVIDGDNIVILSRGETRVTGSYLHADERLEVTAGRVKIDAVDDSQYAARKDTVEGNLSRTESVKHRFESHSRGSELSGATVLLVTEQGDIEITGSQVQATGKVILGSAGDIRIEAGQERNLEESNRHRVSLFSGHSLYQENDRLEGEASTRAVKSGVSGEHVAFDARRDVELIGTDINAAETLEISGRNIRVQNATDESTRYSREIDIRIGDEDFDASLSAISDAFEDDDDGRLRFKLGDAEYHDMDTITHSGEVVSSRIQAGAVAMHANVARGGDILIEGSDITAEELIDLKASGDVEIIDAHRYSSTESDSKGGTAELNFTVQNEYDQAVRAVEAVRAAEQNLRKARAAYDEYQDELDLQQASLDQLKQDLAAGRGFVEQADVDAFESRLNRLEDDEEYYRANIKLAKVTLVSRVTALVQQAARAAASSGTYGFNASLELDIDAYERNIEDFYRQSVGSNLTASSIEIDAGRDAAIRGSTLQANETLIVDARDIEIHAGESTSRHDEKHQKAEFIYRWDMLGGSSTQPASDIGGTLSGDVRKSQSISTQYTNASLDSSSIRLTARGDTAIIGAEIDAVKDLVVETGNLDIVSVQDRASDTTRTQGASFSSSSAGLDVAEADRHRVQTKLTRLTGNRVDITVRGHTELTGAMVASVDEEGQDNGQLSLRTTTLTAGSLVNTEDDKNRSLGVNGAETSTVDYRDDYLSRRTKSLATLGTGNLEIGDQENSETRFLNSDITDTEVAVFDIQSHRGLNAELDTRMVTEDGRSEIAEDWLKTEMIANTVELISTTEKVQLHHFFSETEKYHSTYEAIKHEIARSSELATALQDPGLSAEQKELMLDQLTGAVMVQLGYAEYQNLIIDSETPGRDANQVRGFYSTETGRAFLNDRYLDNTSQILATAGHEATRAMDDQDNVDFDLNREDRRVYAENFGEHFAVYSAHALEASGYDQGLAESNNHVGNDSQNVVTNNREFGALDKRSGDNYLDKNDALLKNQLLDQLFGCGSGSVNSCGEHDRKAMSAVVSALISKDERTTASLTDACRVASSSACRSEIIKLKSALDSYTEDLQIRSSESDGSLSEFIEVASLYGDYKSQAMSENALRAIEHMPVDTLSAGVDLTVLSYRSLNGDEEATRQLSRLADGLAEFVKDPVNTMQEGIKSQLDEADRLEAQGLFNQADEIRSKLFIEAGVAMAGLVGVARQIPIFRISGSNRYLETPRLDVSTVSSASNLPENIKELSLSNITESGKTVLGHHPGYLEKAKNRKASYFDLGESWDDLPDDTQRWAANKYFLDEIAARGDQILLSLPKKDIKPNSWLAEEVRYLLREKGYVWINQWLLKPRK